VEREYILDHLKTILVPCGQGTLMAILYSMARFLEKEPSFLIIIGSVFAFSSHQFIKTRFPLAAFRGFAGSWCWVIRVGIPPFPVFNEPPIYDK